MKRIYRAIGAFLASAVLAASLSGCDIPMPGFADYDVSSYIQALLDSSYHNSHESFIVAAQANAADAAENHASTVENAAVYFCNAYNISPTEQQMAQLQEVFSQVFTKAQYTVKEEQKVDTGYTIEIEVTPITNFSNCKAELEQLLNQAQQEADAANAPSPTPEPEDEEDEDSWDDWDDWEEDSEPESAVATPTPSPRPQVDAEELFVNKVLHYLQQQAAAPAYGAARSMVLDIRQTAEGELQLDLNQIDAIDQAMVPFTQG